MIPSDAVSPADADVRLDRDDLVETLAREIVLRGVTHGAVRFLQAGRPSRPLGAEAMLFFDPVLRRLFGGETAGVGDLLADDDGVELLLDRLEELADEAGWEV